ncbi:MAG TPA: Crp/Fnr family transcriptional regulator [Mycobacterium sp.]|nr:Crp/Fnr family transcriptional regulator [Mycobacterium sp.]HUH72701.1 Crp/Fnr family transcriptional regulator [Mycobacterium sp.]
MSTVVQPETVTAKDIQVITGGGILSHVEPDAASALIKQLHPCEFRARQTIFAQGDPGDRVYIVISGKVKVALRGLHGRQNLRAIMGPTDIFGELAVFDPGPRTCTATAITDVRAVWLDRATLRAWMAHRPVIAEQLLQALARRLRHTEDELVELVSSDVASRVARQLLLLARRFGTREGDALRVVHELSQDEMAQLVGADRVSVNKALRGFTACGWILVEGKSVLIFDPDALACRAAAGTGSGRRPLRATA